MRDRTDTTTASASSSNSTPSTTVRSSPSSRCNGLPERTPFPSASESSLEQPEATTAHTADGSAEPPGQLAEEICLVFAGPGQVTIRPQQHGRHIQFLAAVDDVVDPVGPPGDRESAGSVEE